MKKIIAVTGPTASGKSLLALLLAEKIGGEIISCDSMQLYCGMDIGTAKATKEEQRRIPHHMIDILQIQDKYSVSDYVKEADFCVEKILSKGKNPIVCGGTGLYLDSFLNSIDFVEHKIPKELHENLKERIEKEGNLSLYHELQKHDKITADNISPQDTKRIIRALEVFHFTGITLYEWKEKSQQTKRKYDSLIIGILFENRSKLYERINQRVDFMLDNGLLEETEILIKKGLRESKTAGQAIGYKEFYPYFDAQASLSECREILMRNSRRYAKRQMTWFRKNDQITWITADDKTIDEIYNEALSLCKNFLYK